MRRIDKLVYLDIIHPTLLGLIVLTFIVFARELGNLSSLLVSRTADSLSLLKICLSILPGILIFTIPMSLLLGTLIGISRLSSDNEITALKAGGINLLSLLGPVLFVASILCLINFFIALYFVPLANNQLRVLKFQLTSSIVPSELRPRIFVEDFPNVIFYADDMDETHNKLKGIFLFDQSEANEQNLVIAQTGRLLANVPERKLQLHLEDGRMYKIAVNSSGIRESVSTFVATDIPIILKDQATVLREKNQLEKTTTEILQTLQTATGETAALHRIELHKRLALPIATLVFALLSPPLAVTARKSGRSAGFVMAIVAVLVYYNLFLIGLRLGSVGEVPPTLGVWLANLCLGVAALTMVAFTNREVNPWERIKNRRTVQRFTRFWRQSIGVPLGSLRHALANRFGFANVPTPRYRVARVIDFYVARGVLGYFLLALAACASLFVILTLFDLADDIARHKVPWSLIASYFWYLLPQILALILPIALLIAVLVHFATWEKSCQVMAFKASGVSLYRLAAPALLIAAGLSLGDYVLQESILPFYNQRQDSLRNIIKGRSQTSFKPERKWILGESNQIYNYRYFNDTQNIFVGLNVFTWDRYEYRLQRRVVAEKAMWNGSSWDLLSGWERTYTGSESRLEAFSRRTYTFPEKPDYFKREIFDPKESSKMTYLELKTHIEQLQKSGYDATELEVALHKKVAFPMACLIMALVAVPFAFSVGRKGALGGIAASIGLGIVYWGTLSLFEASGAYGLLAPTVAAWAPNFIFGGSGLYLFLGMKT